MSTRTDELESLMHAVHDVAVRTGALALRHYRTNLQVDIKADGSPVTVADRSAERYARQWIAERYPNDGFVGEESGSARANAPRRWIVDPIDGTTSFVRGVPMWGTIVAVVEGNDVIAGAVSLPALDETLSAARGCGAWWNGHSARVSPLDDLAAATVLTTDARFVAEERLQGWSRLASQSAVARTWGDCYGYVLVATGRAEVMVDDVANAWDIAAFDVIMSEAGGQLTNWDGIRTPFGGDAIATNAALAAEARRVLGARTAAR